MDTLASCSSDRDVGQYYFREQLYSSQISFPIISFISVPVSWYINDGTSIYVSKYVCMQLCKFVNVLGK